MAQECRASCKARKRQLAERLAFGPGRNENSFSSGFDLALTCAGSSSLVAHGFLLFGSTWQATPRVQSALPGAGCGDGEQVAATHIAIRPESYHPVMCIQGSVQPSRLAAVVGDSHGLRQVARRTHSVQPMAVRATA